MIFFTEIACSSLQNNPKDGLKSALRRTKSDLDNGAHKKVRFNKMAEPPKNSTAGPSGSNPLVVVQLSTPRQRVRAAKSCVAIATVKNVVYNQKRRKTAIPASCNDGRRRSPRLLKKIIKKMN